MREERKYLPGSQFCCSTMLLPYRYSAKVWKPVVAMSVRLGTPVRSGLGKLDKLAGIFSKLGTRILGKFWKGFAGMLGKPLVATLVKM